MVAVSLPVICGPTAAGKSALALQVAQSCALGIVSADSRQAYRVVARGVPRWRVCRNGLHQRPHLVDPAGRDHRVNATHDPLLQQRSRVDEEEARRKTGLTRLFPMQR